jgi:hypothetical protein
MGLNYRSRVSQKDSRGHFHVTIHFPFSPKYVDPYNTFHEQIAVELPERCFIYKVKFFLGVDRGNPVEMYCAVDDVYGREIASTGLHKETEGIYDADVIRDTDALTDTVLIRLGGWPTRDTSVRLDWHVVLWCRGWNMSDSEKERVK